MAYDRNLRSLKGGTLTIKDGASASVEVDGDEGGVDFAIPRSARPVRHRGVLQGWAAQPEEPITGSIKLKYSTFYSDTGDSETVTPYEALTQSGEASGYTTVNAIDDGVYTVNLELLIANPKTGKKTEKITLGNVFCSNVNFSEGEESDELSFDFAAMTFTPSRVAA